MKIIPHKIFQLYIIGTILVLLLLNGVILTSSFTDGTNSIESIELYSPKFDPLNIKQLMTLTPVVTPDNALEVHAAWISKANVSIDLQIPYIHQFNSTDWSTDASPIVRGLVDANHRGIYVRVQINEDSDSDDITTYFQGFENISIRWMGNSDSNPDGRWLSDTHNKMLIIDGTVAIISSINFNENAFLNNREAGMVIQNTALATYYTSIFESDWEDGEIPSNPIITRKRNSETYPQPNYKIETVAYTSPTNMIPTNFTGICNVTAFANPDNADEVIFRYLKAAKSSIYVSMYTISRPEFTDTLTELKNNNPEMDIQVLISRRRVGSTENEDTKAAAETLTNSGIPVYNSTEDLNFYHNKYWIIDGSHIFVYSGNWSPRSVAPQLEPGDETYASAEANRDTGIAVHNAPDIATYFKSLWNADVAVAVAWDYNSSWTPTSTESTPYGTILFSIIFAFIVLSAVTKRGVNKK